MYDYYDENGTILFTFCVSYHPKFQLWKGITTARSGSKMKHLMYELTCFLFLQLDANRTSEKVSKDLHRCLLYISLEFIAVPPVVVFFFMKLKIFFAFNEIQAVLQITNLN